MLNVPINQPPALYHHVEVNKSQDPALQHAYEEFLKKYSQAMQLRSFDELRRRQYRRLDKTGHDYLDYTGGSLYADSLVWAHGDLLMRDVFGNPHSSNPTSTLSTQYVEKARTDVLAYFNASPQEYAVIFTQNASGALKLVGEAYPFHEGGTFLLTFDNHNSVNGIREFARKKGARIQYVPSNMPELHLDEALLKGYLDQADMHANNLFAYPAQSNFSGVQHSLEWIKYAQEKGWDVLLDAAAFVPTNRLDLSKCHPDFVDLSFYKMFGYPTGFGCLIAKHEKIKKLVRPWFSGGTIEVVSVLGDGYVLHEGQDAFEDGTINYLNAPAVSLGLRYLQSVGIERIHDHVAILTDWLLEQLMHLQHSNGQSLVRVYGPHSIAHRGGTIAMKFFDPSGEVFDLEDIETKAANAHISLRTGCFCNPGCFELINGLTAQDLQPYYEPGSHVFYEEYIAALEKKDASGAVRVSLGIASNFVDVYTFVQFARTFLDKSAHEDEKDKCGKHLCGRDSGC